MTRQILPQALTARLEPGETVLLHHHPESQVFAYWRRFFLWLFGSMIAVALAVLVAFRHEFAPSHLILFILGAVGLFAALVFGLQIEGKRLDRHTALVTPSRILWAGGGELRFTPGMKAIGSGNAVRIYHRGRPFRLVYPASAADLASAVNRILLAAQSAPPAGKDTK